MLRLTSSDPFERAVTEEAEHLFFELHGLTVVSPSGDRSLRTWIGLTANGPTWADRTVDLWVLAAERGGPMHLGRAGYRWSQTELNRGPVFSGPDFRLEAGQASGQVGPVSWELGLSGGLGEIRHNRGPLGYRMGMPWLRMLTPGAGLGASGSIQVGEERWAVDGWRGLRSHHWGERLPRQHVWAGAVAWEDGGGRVVEACTSELSRRFSAHISRVALLDGPRRTRTERMGTWTDTGLELDMGGVAVSARSERRVALRMPRPGGGTRVMQVAPLARVDVVVGGQTFTSRGGVIERLDGETQINAFPPSDWRLEDGPVATTL